MKNLIQTIAITMLVSISSHADIGIAKKLSCKNELSHFEIVTTAAAEIFQGFYDNGGEQPIVLTCLETQSRQGSLKTVFKCIESRDGDGKVLIDVESGGFVGIKSAVVMQEQIFPLDPVQIDSMICD